MLDESRVELRCSPSDVYEAGRCGHRQLLRKYRCQRLSGARFPFVHLDAAHAKLPCTSIQGSVTFLLCQVIILTRSSYPLVCEDPSALENLMRSNRRLPQLWLDALTTELGASAGTIETYTDDLDCYLTSLDENGFCLNEIGLE